MECSRNGSGAESGARAVAGTQGSRERSGIGEITGGDGCREADAHDPQRADAAERRTPAAGHDARYSDRRPVDVQLAGALRTAGPAAALVSPTVWRVHRRRHDRRATALLTRADSPPHVLHIPVRALPYRSALGTSRRADGGGPAGIGRHTGVPSSHWLSVNCCTSLPSYRITNSSPYG